MRTKIILTCLLLFAVTYGIYAQKAEKQWARVSVNGKSGIIGKTGNELLKPEFDMIGKTNNKVTPVIKDDELYAVNENGQRLPYAPETKGKQIVFSENGKYGVKTDKNVVLVAPKYDFIGKFDGGKAPVFLKGKMGLISDKGIEIIPPIYNYIYDFEKDKALVVKDSLYGLTNEKGVEIIAPQYQKIQKIKGDNYLVLKNGLWGVLNTNGHETVAPKYAAVFPCKDGFKTFFDGQIGMLDDKGSLMFEPAYEEVGAKDANVFIVVSQNRYGILNKEGKQVVAPMYQYIDKFDGGRALILKDNLWGLINTDGTEIIAPQYNGIEKTDDNCYKVYQNDKQGLMDKDGRVIVKAVYHDISIY
ncbi:MAG: WG repeat-containing protein [Dysgonamonadaceae bacterium]|jgi:hypothetical protein|nr:WG repeat-containing protein [Dysgonamonadaceae bacterium]